MRLIRVLEYEGTEDWLTDTMNHNGVKRIHTSGHYGSKHFFAIRELILGRETSLGLRLRLAWKIVRGTY